MLRVYQYPKCSTCRSALRWLDAHSVSYESVDIVQSPPTTQLLAQVLQRSGLPLPKLFNTSGQAYRDGNFKQRLVTLSESEALAALAHDGKLIKRPLVIARDVALVGFDPKAYDAVLQQLRAA